VFCQESADKQAAEDGRRVRRGRWRVSPSTRTVTEPFSLCDSERIKVLSLNCMDHLSSHSKVVQRALCRLWNRATVITSTETIVALI
jgi:hypothetical protein